MSIVQVVSVQPSECRPWSLPACLHDEREGEDWCEIHVMIDYFALSLGVCFSVSSEPLIPHTQSTRPIPCSFFRWCCDARKGSSSGGVWLCVCVVFVVVVDAIICIASVVACFLSAIFARSSFVFVFFSSSFWLWLVVTARPRVRLACKA